MSDITVAVALSLFAMSMSLVLTGRSSIEVARAIAYIAMAIFGAHSIGIAITAPFPQPLGDTLADVAFAWLMIAMLLIAIRGARRSLLTGGRPDVS